MAQELALIQKEQLCPLSPAVWLSKRALHLGPPGWVKAAVPEHLALDIRGEAGVLTPFSQKRKWRAGRPENRPQFSTKTQAPRASLGHLERGTCSPLSHQAGPARDRGRQVCRGMTRCLVDKSNKMGSMQNVQGTSILTGETDETLEPK